MILAIDPGPVESAYVVMDPDTYRPISFDKLPNPDLLCRIERFADQHDIRHAAIEMIASYGMAVGAEVFDTCVWIGRIYAETETRFAVLPELVKRLPVKVHHCHSAKATDANIRQALVDRFAQGFGNHGKGTKANPSPFYGFHRDIWAAYALAVYVADTGERTDR